MRSLLAITLSIPLSYCVWTCSLKAAVANDTSIRVAQTLPVDGDSEQASEEDLSAELYEQAMRIGYAATEQKDYQTALINFRRALEARPGDRYATAAIRNVESYIQRIRAERARRREMRRLQTQLDVAVTRRDWICAASIVDRLITMVPANSIDRGKLVAYRGQISGLLDARTDANSWSTVCPDAPPQSVIVLVLSRFPIAFLHPTPHTLHPVPCTLHPALTEMYSTQAGNAKCARFFFPTSSLSLSIVVIKQTKTHNLF